MNKEPPKLQGAAVLVVGQQSTVTRFSASESCFQSVKFHCKVGLEAGFLEDNTELLVRRRIRSMKVKGPDFFGKQ